MTIEVDKVLFTDGSELGSSDQLLTTETLVQLEAGLTASDIAGGASYTPQSEHDTLKGRVDTLVGTPGPAGPAGPAGAAGSGQRVSGSTGSGQRSSGTAGSGSSDVSGLIEYVSAQQRAALVVVRSLPIPLSFSLMSFNPRSLTFMLYHAYTPEEMLDLHIIKDGYMRIKAPADGPSNYNVFQRDTDFNYGSYRILMMERWCIHRHNNSHCR